MEKYLVSIEFRYSDAPKHEDGHTSRRNTVTIGVYDNFDEACTEGNKALVVMESKYKLNPNRNKRKRFSKNGGCFGSKKSLVSNLAYLQTPFAFYANITTLSFGDVSETIEAVTASLNRYRAFKSKQEE